MDNTPILSYNPTESRKDLKSFLYIFSLDKDLSTKNKPVNVTFNKHNNNKSIESKMPLGYILKFNNHFQRLKIIPVFKIEKTEFGYRIITEKDVKDNVKMNNYWYKTNYNEYKRINQPNTKEYSFLKEYESLNRIDLIYQVTKSIFRNQSASNTSKIKHFDSKHFDSNNMSGGVRGDGYYSDQFQFILDVNLVNNHIITALDSEGNMYAPIFIIKVGIGSGFIVNLESKYNKNVKIKIEDLNKLIQDKQKINDYKIYISNADYSTMIELLTENSPYKLKLLFNGNNVRGYLEHSKYLEIKEFINKLTTFLNNSGFTTTQLHRDKTQQFEQQTNIILPNLNLRVHEKGNVTPTPTFESNSVINFFKIMCKFLCNNSQSRHNMTCSKSNNDNSIDIINSMECLVLLLNNFNEILKKYNDHTNVDTKLIHPYTYYEVYIHIKDNIPPNFCIRQITVSVSKEIQMSLGAIINSLDNISNNLPKF